jgi:Uncharacterized protein conserved in bacteria (DUF2325)
MRVAVVGGLDRHVPALAELAEEAGHSAEFHQGRVGGRHAAELEAIVERSDVAIVVIGVNSHGAVAIAKKAARRSGGSVLIERTCGPSRFAQILASLTGATTLAGVSRITRGTTTWPSVRTSHTNT